MGGEVAISDARVAVAYSRFRVLGATDLSGMVKTAVPVMDVKSIFDRHAVGMDRINLRRM